MTRIIVLIALLFLPLAVLASEKCAVVKKVGDGWDARFEIVEWNGWTQLNLIIPMNSEVRDLLMSIKGSPIGSEKLCFDGGRTLGDESGINHVYIYKIRRL